MEYLFSNPYFVIVLTISAIISVIGAMLLLAYKEIGHKFVNAGFMLLCIDFLIGLTYMLILVVVRVVF